MPCIYPHARDRAIRRRSPSYVGRQSNWGIGLTGEQLSITAVSIFVAKKGRSRPARVGFAAGSLQAAQAGLQGKIEAELKATTRMTHQSIAVVHNRLRVSPL